MRINVFVSEGTRRMAHQLDDLLERWHLSKDKEEPEYDYLKTIVTVPEIKPIKAKKQYFSNNTASRMSMFSEAELVKLRIELDAANVNAKYQIRSFNVQSRDEKDYQWLQQAKRIQETYAALIQILQIELGKKHRLRRGLSQIFMEVAAERLEPMIFNDIKSIAKQRLIKEDANV